MHLLASEIDIWVNLSAPFYPASNGSVLVKTASAHRVHLFESLDNFCAIFEEAQKWGS